MRVKPAAARLRDFVDDLLHHAAVYVGAGVGGDPDQVDAAVGEGAEVLAQRDVEDDVRADERADERDALLDLLGCGRAGVGMWFVVDLVGEDRRVAVDRGDVRAHVVVGVDEGAGRVVVAAEPDEAFEPEQLEVVEPVAEGPDRDGVEAQTGDRRRVRRVRPGRVDAAHGRRRGRPGRRHARGAGDTGLRLAKRFTRARRFGRAAKDERRAQEEHDATQHERDATGRQSLLRHEREPAVWGGWIYSDTCDFNRQADANP